MPVIAGGQRSFLGAKTSLRLEHNANHSIVDSVKLIANIQLTPTAEQAKSLRDTLERCNAACNAISQRGFDAGVTRQYDLHKLLYVDARKSFELTAQAAVRCIAKVADAYTTQKATGREGVVRFRKHAAQPYDDRIFRFVADNMVSIWTLVGRMKIAFVSSERQHALLAFRKGEVDLMLVRGKWYLAVVCDVPDPEKVGIEDVLGIDFGVVNLACDSDGRPAPTSNVSTAPFAVPPCKVMAVKAPSGAQKKLADGLSPRYRPSQVPGRRPRKRLLGRINRQQRRIGLQKHRARKAERRHRVAGWCGNCACRGVIHALPIFAGMPCITLQPILIGASRRSLLKILRFPA
jgi:putative transposase